jgi:hypothetical protein
MHLVHYMDNIADMPKKVRERKVKEDGFRGIP